jgi:hypothetical protein
MLPTLGQCVTTDLLYHLLPKKTVTSRRHSDMELRFPDDHILRTYFHEPSRTENQRTSCGGATACVSAWDVQAWEVGRQAENSARRTVAATPCHTRARELQPIPRNAAGLSSVGLKHEVFSLASTLERYRDFHYALF